MDMSDAMQIESAGSGDYNAQLAAITALRERDPRSDELRRVRETMAAQFPLSPDIWEDWIDDEASDAPNAPRRRYILDLCARAVQDYLGTKSRPLWRSGSI